MLTDESEAKPEWIFLEQGEAMREMGCPGIWSRTPDLVTALCCSSFSMVAVCFQYFLSKMCSHCSYPLRLCQKEDSDPWKSTSVSKAMQAVFGHSGSRKVAVYTSLLRATGPNPIFPGLKYPKLSGKLQNLWTFDGTKGGGRHGRSHQASLYFVWIFKACVLTGGRMEGQHGRMVESEALV